MKWLEFIRIRTFGDQGQTLAPELLKAVAAGLEAPGLLESVLYDHASIPGDLGITLLWDTARPENRGSGIALHLIRELRNFGLVDYSVWVARIA